MVGTNQEGTCDGEPLTDNDDAPGAADSPEPAADDIDVVQRTWTNAEPANRLDCTPETRQTARGKTFRLFCSAFRGDAPVGDTEIDVEATGANDPDGTDSKLTPDFSCRTGADGRCSITHFVPRGGSTGKTTYRAWVDENYYNGSAEADNTEQRDEEATGAGGAVEEPDTTDVTENVWVPNPRRTISIDSSRKKQQRGRKVRIFGRIIGDPACEPGQTVRLRAARPNGKFKTINATTTDDLGRYVFRGVLIRRTRYYKSVAIKTPSCGVATSRTIKITATR